MLYVCKFHFLGLELWALRPMPLAMISAAMLYSWVSPPWACAWGRWSTGPPVSSHEAVLHCGPPVQRTALQQNESIWSTSTHTPGLLSISTSSGQRHLHRRSREIDLGTALLFSPSPYLLPSLHSIKNEKQGIWPDFFEKSDQHKEEPRFPVLWPMEGTLEILARDKEGNSLCFSAWVYPRNFSNSLRYGIFVSVKLPKIFWLHFWLH